MTITNNAEGQQLLAFIERVERVDSDMAELREDRKEIIKEARSNGYDTDSIRRILKMRKMGRDARMEAQAIDEMYMHSIGMDDEPPLLRAMEAAEVDPAGAQSVIEAFKKFCPADGSVEVTMGGSRWWISRNSEGQPTAVEASTV